MAIAARRSRRFAAQVYTRFRARPGSEHIATQAAIEGLVRWLARTRPRRVLELGAGIGTLTYAVVETLTRRHGADGFTVVSTEDHPFCLEQLRANLAGFEDRFEIVESAGALPQDMAPFDFVITDGGDPTDSRPFEHLVHGAVVFIEGDRQPQAARLEAALAGRRWAKADVRLLRRRRLEDGTTVWDGGYRIYQLDPSPLARLRLALIGLRTKLVYRVRRFIS